MRTHIFLICFITCSSSLLHCNSPQIPSTIDPRSVIENDLVKLDNLIETTEKSLTSQQKLRGLIQEYQTLQSSYLRNGERNELLLPMVKLAYKIITLIENNHLHHIFDAEFLNELTIFSRMAVKKSIPQP